jgi:hypothetical protein
LFRENAVYLYCKACVENPWADLSEQAACAALVPKRWGSKCAIIISKENTRTNQKGKMNEIVETEREFFVNCTVSKGMLGQ